MRCEDRRIVVMGIASPLSRNFSVLQSAARDNIKLLSKEGARTRVPLKKIPAKASSREHICSSSISERDETPSSQDSSTFKFDLLGLVAGLDRGLLASESDIVKIDTSAGLLENSCGPLKLGDGECLQGRWRLVYSSAFSSGSLGGRRPGPPVGLLPFSLGQVYQRVDVLARELDNIVELQLRSPWPLPPVEITATLSHTFEILGDAIVKITFERTSAKLGGGLSPVPPFTIPQLPEFLRPSSNMRSGSFECTYLDENMRISRGDRGELRIFVLA